MRVGSYIEIKYKTKGGEVFYSTQEVLDKDSPVYFSYPSGVLLLSLNFESQIAKARVTSWSDPFKELYGDFYY